MVSCTPRRPWQRREDKTRPAIRPSAYGRRSTTPTGKVKSVVRIWVENNKLYGRIQKIVDPDLKDKNPTCDDCTGDQKGKRVLGLRILWDLRKDGDGWSGGSILDPESGKIYKCLLSVEDGGKKLKVRGYLGVSLLGRTQYWLRE